MTERKFQVAVSGFITTGKLPKGDTRWATFTRSFTNVDVTMSELLEYQRAGWSMTTQHNGIRSEANYIAGQVIGLDFDHLERIEEITENTELTDIAGYVYTTPSHTEAAPRVRVMIFLDRPILRTDRLVYDEATNQNIPLGVTRYRDAVAALLHRFGATADQQCKDASRFFYGSAGCTAWEYGNVLSLEKLGEWVGEWRKVRDAQIAQERKLIDQVKSYANTAPPQKLVDAILAAHVRRIETAMPGDKHATRLRSALAVGGYIAAGYLSYSDALDRLSAAVRANTTDYRSAVRTLRWGLDKGQQRPLFITSYATESLSIADTVAPPYHPDPMWLDGFQAGLRHGMDMANHAQSMWKALGWPDWAIESLSLSMIKRIDPETGEICEYMTLPMHNAKGELVNIEMRPLSGGEPTYATDNTDIAVVKPGTEHIIVPEFDWLPKLLDVDFGVGFVPHTTLAG